MRKMTIVAVGKIKEPYWREAQEEFLKRLVPFANVDIIEVEPEPLSPTVTAGLSMKKEGERILKRLPAAGNARVIAMDKGGRGYTSEVFAETLEKWTESGDALIFVIGGTAGLDRTVLDRATSRISLSDMTFTHEMARIFLLEQLYRASTILAGKSYHH